MLTKGAIGNLVNRYKAVLAKCNLINTFGSLAVASMLVLGGAGVAEATVTLIKADGRDTYKGISIKENATIDLANGKYTFSYPGAGSSGTETNALQILKNADKVTIKNGTINVNNSGDIPSGQKPIKRLIQNYANLTLDGVTVDGRGINLAGSTPGDYVMSFNNGNSTITNSTIIANADDYAFDVYYWKDGGYASSIVEVNDSTINGRIIIDGDVDALVGDDKLKLTINGGSISGNSTTNEYGGAIYSKKKYGELVVNGTSFTSNSAISKHGGAIFSKGKATITGATFENNTAFSGGAFANSTSGSSETSITGSTFKDNKVLSAGGAIAAWNDITITDTTFTNNSVGYDIGSLEGDSSSDGGGAIIIGMQAKNITIDNSTFTGNKTTNRGGALSIRAKNFYPNESKGRAIITIADSTFTSNSAGGTGGAISNVYDATVNITKGTFEANTAGSHGGAIYNGKDINFGDSDTGTQTTNHGIFTITDSTFSNNTSGKLGGAIYNDEGGTVTLKNVTFSGNTDSTGANDIHNLGTLIVEGEATFDGGISGNGVVNGSGTIVVNDKAATFSGTAADTLKAKGSAKLNDQTGGDLNALNKQLEGLGIKASGMEEGLIAGAVDASGKQAPNTIMQGTLDMATAAPLAISRIVMNDVRKRMGDLRSTKEESGVWMRWEGGKLKGDAGLTNNFNTIQVGADTMTGLKNVRAGVAAAFTHGDLDHRNGEGENETFSFSAYGTWMADNGMFADVIARVGFSNTETTVKNTRVDLDNEVLSLSGEYGWRLPVCNQFFVEPQVELTYTYVSSADSKVQYATYDIDSMDSLIGRAGLVAGWNLPDDMGSVYARASVVREFLGDGKITGTAFGNSISYENDGDDTWLEYGIGANVKLTEKTYIWADVERTEGADIEEEWRGTVGVRFSF